MTLMIRGEMKDVVCLLLMAMMTIQDWNGSSFVDFLDETFTSILAFFKPLKWFEKAWRKELYK